MRPQCGSGLARESGLMVDHYPTEATRSNCGSWLVGSPHRCDSGESAYISVVVVTATYGSALTAAHFWKDPKVSKRSSPV